MIRLGGALLALSTAVGAETPPAEPDWFADLTAAGAEEVAPPSPWFGALEVDGFFAGGGSSADQERARARWNLRGGWQGELDPALKGRIAVWWRHETRDDSGNGANDDVRARENVFELDESYLEWMAAAGTSSRIGRQKIGFGYAQGFRVLDAFSPVDNRIPGYGQLNQLKLPQGAMSLSYSIGEWSHRGVVLVEQRRDLTDRDGIFAQPPPGGVDPFAPKPGWLYAMSHHYGEWDWQVVFGEAFNPMALADAGGGFYQRESSAGLSLSKVDGAVRWFTENRWFSGSEVVSDSTSSRPIGGRRHLVGLTYNGISHLTLQAEARRDVSEGANDDALFIGTQYFTWDDRVEWRWQHSALSTLKASVDNFSVDYGWRDGWHFMGGLLIYDADRGSPLEPLEAHDRVYLALNYFW